MSQAQDHWKKFQPNQFKALKKAGKLEAALKEAAERTYKEMTPLDANGFYEWEAWEMVREKYLFQPEEPKLKAKNDRKLMAIKLARPFNSVERLKSALTGGDE
ncbi:MAG: hypothetical protein ACLPSW_15505 [Roseiarcus sp.]